MQTKTLTVTLTNAERIYLSDLLDKVEGNYVLLKDIRELKEELSFDSKERTEIGLTINNDSVGWEKDLNKEFTITDFVNERIKNILSDMDKSNRLEQKHLTLYEKFILANKQ